MTVDAVRDARNREVMATHDLDALVCRLPENVLLLTGYWPLSGSVFVLQPREGAATLIVPHTEMPLIPDDIAGERHTFPIGIIGAPDPHIRIEELLAVSARDAGVAGGQIGIESSFELVATGHTGGEVQVPAAVTRATIERALPQAEIVDGTTALHDARARKTPLESAKLRRANTVACFGLEKYREMFGAGRTEAEVAAAVEATIMERGIGHDGAQHVRAWAQLMTGPGSSWAYSMHPATSARTIEAGDLGVLELGTHVDGYWSDLTRTLVAGGRSNSRQSEMYGAVVRATEAVIRGARPGMTGGEVDSLARDEIRHSGLAEYFVHQTGHGLGFRYHESAPTLHPDNRDPVLEGMVSSVEPGLYLDGFGGMRLEENVVMTDSGVELLSWFERSLEG